MALGSLSYIDGKTYDGSGTWYCGRMLGMAAITGSDGQCGPDNGPACKSCWKLTVNHRKSLLECLNDDKNWQARLILSQTVRIGDKSFAFSARTYKDKLGTAILKENIVLKKTEPLKIYYNVPGDPKDLVKFVMYSLEPTEEAASFEPSYVKPDENSAGKFVEEPPLATFSLTHMGDGYELPLSLRHDPGEEPDGFNLRDQNSSAMIEILCHTVHLVPIDPDLLSFMENIGLNDPETKADAVQKYGFTTFQALFRASTATIEDMVEDEKSGPGKWTRLEKNEFRCHFQSMHKRKWGAVSD